VKGHKIGLTSRAMQLSSQIDEPDYGTLLDDMFFEQGGDIPFKRFIAPRIEVELAFILGKLQGPNVTIFDVLAATDYVVPAIEIIDARIEQFDRHTKAPRKVFDTISRQRGQCGHRDGRPAGAARRGRPALGRRAALPERRDRGDRRGRGVLNHPATGVAWLANKLAPWDEYLEAGEVVLGGSFTRPTTAVPGDTFHADYGPLGAISFRFV
jgi:2-oxo-hept-3-ene-1,7-dioate hydratase